MTKSRSNDAPRSIDTFTWWWWQFQRSCRLSVNAAIRFVVYRDRTRSNWDSIGANQVQGRPVQHPVRRKLLRAKDPQQVHAPALTVHTTEVDLTPALRSFEFHSCSKRIGSSIVPDSDARWLSEAAAKMIFVSTVDWLRLWRSRPFFGEGESAINFIGASLFKARGEKTSNTTEDDWGA